MKWIYFARAMDGLKTEEILASDSMLKERLSGLGFDLVNPYEVELPFRSSTSGIARIVHEDLILLSKSDLLLADLSIRGRSYVGALFEIARARELGVPVISFTGESGLASRIWLQFYCSAICDSLEEALQLMELAFSDRGRMRSEKAMLAYYDSIASVYGSPEYEDAILRSQADEDQMHRVKSQSRELERWLDRIEFGRNIIDLGGGSGRWTQLVGTRGRRIVLIDLSRRMLDEAAGRNWPGELVLLNGDVRDAAIIQRAVDDLECVDTVCALFVLSSIADTDAFDLLESVKCRVGKGVRLVVADNQRSAFSNRPYFSRIEIQNRMGMSAEERYLLVRRNYLEDDIERILQLWGTPEGAFQTSDYFVGGTALSA